LEFLETLEELVLEMEAQVPAVVVGVLEVLAEMLQVQLLVAVELA
jgi:hypothetical protein